jgi:hypothetical protein
MEEVSNWNQVRHLGRPVVGDSGAAGKPAFFGRAAIATAEEVGRDFRGVRQREESVPRFGLAGKDHYLAAAVLRKIGLLVHDDPSSRT